MILILDEPTSALSITEAESLFAVIEELKQSGVTIVYISHRLHELLHLGDYFTVLRSGGVGRRGAPSRSNQDPGSWSACLVMRIRPTLKFGKQVWSALPVLIVDRLDLGLVRCGQKPRRPLFTGSASRCTGEKYLASTACLAQGEPRVAGNARRQSKACNFGCDNSQRLLPPNQFCQQRRAKQVSSSFQRTVSARRPHPGTFHPRKCCARRNHGAVPFACSKKPSM